MFPKIYVQLCIVFAQKNFKDNCNGKLQKYEKVIIIIRSK